LAQQAGVAVTEESLTRAEEWLRIHLVELEPRPDDAAWALHALSTPRSPAGPPAAGALETAAFEKVYARREQLNSGARALLALVAHRFGWASQARVLVENLENGVVREDRPDRSVIYGGAVSGGSAAPTLHWGGRGSYGRWTDGEVEATAFAVRALLATDPQNKMLEPAVTWLLQNRRGASWSNTRDTAITLLALTDYLAATGELKQSLEAEVEVNGRPLTRINLSPGESLRAPAEIPVPEDWLRDVNEVRILRRGGQAPIYFGVRAQFFTREAPAPAGSELFVRREYFKLAPVETLLEGVRETRIPLAEGDAVSSGDLVECRLVFEGKNDLEYLVFEDHKPAGFEATAVQSGWGPSASQISAEAAQASGGDVPTASGSASLYYEWRDRRAAIFASRLGAGFWEIRYRYLAETPGRFTALPVVAEAMYVPGLAANSAARIVRVTDGER
ncbi:MAG: alpha-2-macroglobulin, partial [Verrucomicrobiae bacterium]|nr:alpha-2-macroglobulin [Verrucomicrobiae bacterium]